MVHWIVDLIGSLGLAGVCLLMAIENVVLPIPSELIMPLAGFAAARGHYSLLLAILFGTVGSVVGALPVYGAARWLGEERVKQWLQRHGRWLMLRRRDFDKPTRWFHEHGGLAVGLGQLVPGVRGLISLPAGYAHMNVARFIFWNFVGTAVWCTVLAVAGFYLGRHFDAIHKYLGPVSWVVLGALVIAAVAWIIRRRQRARARAA